MSMRMRLFFHTRDRRPRGADRIRVRAPHAAQPRSLRGAARARGARPRMRGRRRSNSGDGHEDDQQDHERQQQPAVRLAVGVGAGAQMLVARLHVMGLGHFVSVLRRVRTRRSGRATPAIASSADAGPGDPCPSSCCTPVGGGHVDLAQGTATGRRAVAIPRRSPRPRRGFRGAPRAAAGHPPRSARASSTSRRAGSWLRSAGSGPAWRAHPRSPRRTPAAS